MVSMLHTIVGADGVNHRSKAPAPEGVSGRVQKQALVHVVGNFVQILGHCKNILYYLQVFINIMNFHPFPPCHQICPHTQNIIIQIQCRRGQKLQNELYLWKHCNKHACSSLLILCDDNFKHQFAHILYLWSMFLCSFAIGFMLDYFYAIYLPIYYKSFYLNYHQFQIPILLLL